MSRRRQQKDEEIDADVIGILSLVERLAVGLYRMVTIWMPDDDVRKAAQEDAKRIERNARRGRQKMINKHNKKKRR